MAMLTETKLLTQAETQLEEISQQLCRLDWLLYMNGSEALGWNRFTYRRDSGNSCRVARETFQSSPSKIAELMGLLQCTVEEIERQIRAAGKAGH